MSYCGGNLTSIQIALKIIELVPSARATLCLRFSTPHHLQSTVGVILSTMEVLLEIGKEYLDLLF